MTSRLKLAKPYAVIISDMYKEISRELNVRVRKNKRRIDRAIRLAAKGWILEQPEVASLSADGVPGELAAQFGLLPGQGEQVANSIATAVSESVVINVKPFTPKLSGSIELGIQPTVLSNVLSIPGGSVVTEKGTTLAWLEWLLTQGDSIIITGYHYDPEVGEYSESRSGAGVMKKGEVFRVPPEYAGDPTDNFITRALTGRNAEITSIMDGLFS